MDLGSATTCRALNSAPPSHPSFDRAVISPEKLRDYVLSAMHPVGRFKAAFFLQLGYGQGDWQKLADDLRAQHLALDAENIETTRYGTKYRIVGFLTGPAGRTARVVSIWIVRASAEAPHLVTLSPGGR